MNARVTEKPLIRNILGRFGKKFPAHACAPESGFVNHASLMFRISLSQGRFQGPPSRRADLKPGGEEGDWHARIAD
jgi:hypothetical protein